MLWIGYLALILQALGRPPVPWFFCRHEGLRGLSTFAVHRDPES